MNPPLRVLFLGSRQAGCMGLLTVLGVGLRVIGVVAYDDSLKRLAQELKLPILSSIRQDGAESCFREADLVVSVHGREIVPERLLRLCRLGGINAHPCLWKYKGAGPIERMLRDGSPRASVGVHRMIERVDEGEVLAEEFIPLSGERSVGEVYNTLYPLYATALLKAIGKLEG